MEFIDLGTRKTRDLHDELLRVERRIGQGFSKMRIAGHEVSALAAKTAIRAELKRRSQLRKGE